MSVRPQVGRPRERDMWVTARASVSAGAPGSEAKGKGWWRCRRVNRGARLKVTSSWSPSRAERRSGCRLAVRRMAVASAAVVGPSAVRCGVAPGERMQSTRRRGDICTAAAAAAASTATSTFAPPAALVSFVRELGSGGSFLLVGLLAMSSFFALAETSISTMWPWKVRWLARTEGQNSPFGLLERDVQRFVTTCLLGSTITNIGATAIVTETATKVLGNSSTTIAIVTAVVTVVMLLVTEVMPKTVAVESAQTVMSTLVYPLSWLAKVFYPVGWLFTSISRSIFGLFGYKTSSNLTADVSEEELMLMLKGAENSGAIESEENDMIGRVLGLESTSVEAIMTPLFKVRAVDRECTVQEWYELWKAAQFSRMPVYEDRIDNIVGLCYSNHILEQLAQRTLGGPGDAAGSPMTSAASSGSVDGSIPGSRISFTKNDDLFFVPESMTVWNMLKEFRKKKVHMAIVVNEYGGAAGIVTLEDVVEEIVGEIYDETDRPKDETGSIVEVAKDVWTLNADVGLAVAGKAMRLQFPDQKYRNVGAYVCDIFDSIPQPGESMTTVVDVAETSSFSSGGKDDGEDAEAEMEDGSFDPSKRRITVIVTSGTSRKVMGVKVIVDLISLDDADDAHEEAAPTASPPEGGAPAQRPPKPDAATSGSDGVLQNVSPSGLSRRLRDSFQPGAKS